MIPWIWVVIAAIIGMFAGVLAMGLLAGGARYDLEMDNMILRERLKRYEAAEKSLIR